MTISKEALAGFLIAAALWAFVLFGNNWIS
jgi:hypothetical protein